MIKHTYIVILLMICNALSASGITKQDVSELILRDSLPVYVRIVNNPDSIHYGISDSLYNEIAARYIFPVNISKLRHTDPLLDEIRDDIIPLTEAVNLRLVGIDIRGAASPEGPYWNNVRLSKERARALINYIDKYASDDVINSIEVTTIAEDYPLLLWELKKINDSAAPILERYIREEGLDHPHRIKERLKAYNQGRTWRRLLRDIYPRLRAARIVLYFAPVEPPFVKPEYVLVPADMVVEVPQMPIEPLETLEPTPAPIALSLANDRRHVLSVSSNLLYDAFYMPNYGMAPMPNIGIEYYPAKGNWTYRAAFTFPYYHKWSQNKFFQIRDYHVEVRRYFHPGRWHTGTYLGAYANATKYGIGLSKTKGWEGEGLGGALKLGYVMHKGPLRFDFHIAAGGWYTRYDPYVYGNPITGEEDGDYYYDYTGKKTDFIRRNHRFSWLGPTEAGISITFDILFKNVKM